MTPELIQRYQPGGDLYASEEALFGTAGANSIAQAALTGDETIITATRAQLQFGATLNTSTADILATQLATDPLAAPLASANTLLQNSFLSFLKNPWVLFAVAAGIFLWLGGADLLKGILAKKK